MSPSSHGRWPLLRSALVSLTVLAAGCSHDSDSGRIEVKYKQYDPQKEKSKDPDHYEGAASGAWCPGARRFEITSMHDDMGFGLVVYPVDSLVAGTYDAFDPGMDTGTRPAAAAVARWYTEQRIIGLQSDSGALKLSRNGESYDATFGFRFRSLDGYDTTLVAGRFSGVRPGPCPVDSVPGTAPKQ
jgi:hypothetical protein